MEIKRKESDFIVTVSPHVRSVETVPRIMWTVVVSLLPALLCGVYFFGLRVIFVTALCIVGALFSEWFVEKLAGKPITIGDGSAFLSGLLLGLTMPVTVPFYIPLISSFIAVGITKQIFGGIGYNIFNPALIGRAFALITWPRAMTSWVEPSKMFDLNNIGAAFSNIGMWLDGKTSATPLGILKLEGIAKVFEPYAAKADLYMNLLIGQRAGSIGETSVIAILIGALFLMLRRYISWHIPVSYLATVGLFSWILGGKEGLFTGDALLHVLSGGLMLGAFFMATDYVTSPSVKKGRLVFGFGCGILTVLIRLKAGYPEGVMFAILIMNCFAPLIDRNLKQKVFGLRKGK
ncbi:MAG: RnfABCDGE type electron transport complex subunit D [Candidatus Magnetoovum sp. WYHC-5]|nr:RnfABCDGE type electron transport complex subunit D [Candidatus Magnetoovum sp. WYHC-5]MCI4627088.1 RnfABCDGE type electron transport complex subunit D [Candidatus Magnetoovum sp. WYHC-5]